MSCFLSGYHQTLHILATYVESQGNCTIVSNQRVWFDDSSDWHSLIAVRYVDAVITTAINSSLP